MRDDDHAKLLKDTQRELLAGAGPAAVLGLTPVALRLLASLAPAGLDRCVEAIYAPGEGDCGPGLTVPVRPLPALREAGCQVLVVAADAEKEDLLCAALPFIAGTPKVIVAGYGTRDSGTGRSRRHGRSCWCRRWRTATRTRKSTSTSAWPTQPAWGCPGRWQNSACSRAAPPVDT